MKMHLGGAGRDANEVLAALGRSMAIIEFDPTGKILFANENFCNALGYAPAEIQGRHHSMFVEPAYAESPEYREFWRKLAAGEFDAREYKRIGKAGKEVWIQASYNPVIRRGKVIKVVKAAADITEAKLRSAVNEAKMNAVSRAQAVIEFNTKGEVVAANENFLNALGYTLDEIAGCHHRMFVDPSEANSPDYEAFWRRLNAGEVFSAEFRRIGKGGREVWIQASYNPIYDLNGAVSGVVKFATDITGRVEAVQAIAGGLAHLADGDLGFRLTTPIIPAFEKVRTDFNLAMDRLAEAMSVLSVAEGMTGGIAEISQAADDLSRRTEQQAATLEETAAALDEITTTVKSTAEGANRANSVVATARQDAEHSGEVVRLAVSAMGGIERSAGEISQIIGVIDEIAFQTNLLALNAGVEAARAGDAGKGFAVVASEVRALAQRSAEAAKEIKALISTSATQVKEGVDLVGKTGEALQRIVGQVSEITSLVSEIAASAQEQSTALAEVNTAVNQMDQMTQQNAAMVEQSTAASHALAQEAQQLSELVARFQIGGAGGQRRDTSGAPRLKAQRALRTVGSAALKAAPDGETWEEF